MVKKSLEELLGELNREDKEKFEFILSFYSDEHVYYNFDYFKHALKDFKTFTHFKVTRPIPNRFKYMFDKIDLRDITSYMEEFKTSYINDINKDVNDLLVYLLSYTDMPQEKIDKILINSDKYEDILDRGLITGEEIFEIITSSFNNEIFGTSEYEDGTKPINLTTVEYYINDKLRNRLLGSMSPAEMMPIFSDTGINPDDILILSDFIVRDIDYQKCLAIYDKEGNISTKDKSIFVVQKILGDDFDTADRVLIERLKSMLRGFDIARMTKEDVDLFVENIDDIKNKGMDIADIFYVKNIVSSPRCLRAFNELPERLKDDVLKYSIVANEDEVSVVLDILNDISVEEREKRRREEIIIENENGLHSRQLEDKQETHEKFEYILKNISRIPQDKRQKFLDIIRKAEENREYKYQLDLDDRITFGIELELEGIRAKSFSRIIEQKSLYRELREKTGADTNFSGFIITTDGTVPKGLEIDTPVFKDRESDWKKIAETCKFLRELEAKPGDTCSTHVHVGTHILGTDEQAWKNFFDIWRIAEKNILLMGLPVGEEYRLHAIEQASPSKPIIDDLFDKDLIKIQNQDDVKKVATEYSKRFIKLPSFIVSGRTKAMNLECLASGKQPTVEFRFPNGLIDENEIQKTIYLCAKIVETAKKLAEDPEYKKDIWEEFKESKDDDERTFALLDLLFDDPEFKVDYLDRYFSRDRLHMSGFEYEDIVSKGIEEAKDARYEWRGYR